MILLVTASREWPVMDKRDIWLTLDRWYGERSMGWPPDERLVVRHGGARGGDTFVEEWVEDTREHLGEWCDLVSSDVHPVSREAWRANPSWAGKARNLAMIQMYPPPDYVIAFSYQNSGGTSHCWNEAHVNAQIPGLFISWEVMHGYSDHAGRGGVVAAGQRAESAARAPGESDGDRLF